MKIAEAFVEVRADTTGFGSSVQKEATSAADRAKHAFRNLLAGVAVGALFKGAFNEIQEAEKSAKQLEQTIRSTGGAAGVTAKHASELADQIGRASTLDDELVANTERVLLRFTNIKNSGIDKTFDRTTQAAVDLAAALGTEAPQAALILGKALEDPVKGMTRLQRAGIILTDAQKKQVEAFTAAGDAAKAQGVILDVVEKQVGGQAAAAATDADKAKVAFQNLEESLGRALLPVINDAAKGLTVLSDAFSAQPGVLQQVEIGAIAAALAYAKFGPAIKGAVTSLKEFQTANSALKSGVAGAAGPAAIAVAVTALAVAGFKLTDAFAASKLRNVKGNIDDITLSLQNLTAGDTGGIDAKGLAKDFDTLDSTAGRIARNPVFSGTPFHGGASAAFKAAKEDVDAFDKSLAATVEAGHADKAAAQIRALSEITGISVKDLKAKFDDYTGALTHNAVVAGNAAEGGKKLTDSQRELAGIADAAGRKFESLNDEIDHYLGKILSADEATGNFQKALNDQADAVKTAGGHFNDTTNASIDFNTAQRAIVTDAGAVLQALRDQGATASEVRDRQKGLADQYYLTAIANGVPLAVAQKYRDAILGIPTSRKTVLQVFLDDQEAIRKLTDLGNRINSLGGGRSGGFDVAAFVAANRAMGGPVRKGQAYVVGENQPELFVPDQNGTIVPNVSGAGTTINVYGVIGDQEAVGRHLVGVLNDHQKRYGR